METGSATVPAAPVGVSPTGNRRSKESLNPNAEIELPQRNTKSAKRVGPHSLSSIGWRRGSGRGGALVSTDLDCPSPRSSPTPSSHGEEEEARLSLYYYPEKFAQAAQIFRSAGLRPAANCASRDALECAQAALRPGSDLSRPLALLAG